MLIDASEKKNLLAFQAMITSDHVSQHFLVSVADMRRRVCVIDRGGDIESLGHARNKLMERYFTRNSRSRIANDPIRSARAGTAR